VFEKDLSYFFQRRNALLFRRSREKDRIRLSLGLRNQPFWISESLSGLIPDQTLIPYIIEFLPNVQEKAFEPQFFNGKEFVYVISGSLKLSVNKEDYFMGSHDAAWIGGTVPRQYHCDGLTPTRVLIMSIPCMRRTA
jgi:glyoxylate utilization-related uncharacterized protein